MTNNEMWRPIPGYEGFYEISSFGRLRNVKTGYMTFGHRQKANGYMYVNLFVGGSGRNFRAHILVLHAFSGHRPDGLYARHLDGNRMNNALSNLAWGSALDNHLDAVSHGTYTGHFVGKFFDDHPNGKISRHSAEILFAMREYFQQKQLAKIFGMSQSGISRLLRRVRVGASEQEVDVD